MNNKYLGTTDLKISPIGFGVGGIFGMKMFENKKAEDILRSAIDNGINFFDTGSSYSGGHAEIRLGKVLGSSDLSKLVVATKGGTVIGSNGRLFKDYSTDSLNKYIDESLQKLRVEKIDLFQLHSPSVKHLTDDVYECLDRLKEVGKIRYAGVSCDGVTLDHVIDKAYFDSVMCTYNVLTQDPLHQIKAAKEKGIGVLIKSPMAHSLYSNDIFKIRSKADVWYLLRALKNFRGKLLKGRKYRFINDFEGWSGAEVALKFVEQNQYVDAAMIGTTRLKHLIGNIDTIGRSLPQSIIKQISEVG